MAAARILVNRKALNKNSRQKVQDTDNPVIRAMTADDLPAVAALEREAYPYPWSLSSFADSHKAGDDCWVMLICNEIVAHGILTIVLDDATILNIAVAPVFQRKGLGKLMLTHLLARARFLQARHCFLEVRPSNTAAIRLYTQAGFIEVGRRPGYYPAAQGREDALVLELEWQKA